MRLLMIFLIALSSLPARSEENINMILVTAESRHHATEEDGTGLYWDILRAVFEPQGIQVASYNTSFGRAIGLVRYRQADAIVGVYEREADTHGLLLPDMHLDSDVVSVVFKKGHISWQGWQALDGLHIGKVRGYSIDERLDYDLRPHRLRNHHQLLHYLKKGDLDVVVNTRNNLRIDMQQGQLDPEQWEVITVDARPFFVAFANTPRGRLLAQKFDTGMSQLIGTAKLGTLYEHWQWDSFDYDSRNSTLVAERYR